ncbi:acyl-CoA carboxylase subunit epsilon [Streptomyces sp. CHD11]|uniref:acyl-CoA carboxylase subunit epsilon n=1 Tax=Streptomyces sp. CHD11 TaxID=2741325 RepID=UPI001BFC7F9B|nr:acyl-CoA carboxylase subunit epsilon [Streptomyces sp. CHD11]MBT3151348.1 acyl-CoA carboxylase subunit epsilon [Streptomyces sp. CHD11]
MGEPGVMGPALRIERGRADADELAALTVVLCSVLAGRAVAEEGGQEPSVSPSWRCADRSGAAYRSPHCWR